MRKYSKLLIAFTAVITCSCGMNNIVEIPNPDTGTEIWEATFDSNWQGTRTELFPNDGTVTWKKGDIINFMNGGTEVLRGEVIGTDESGRKATIKTTRLKDGEPLMAFYPGAAGFEPVEDTKNEEGERSISYTLPDVQSGKFEDANICAAYISEGSQTLNFKPIANVFEFQVSDPAVKKITVSFRNDKAAARTSGEVWFSSKGTAYVFTGFFAEELSVNVDGTGAVYMAFPMALYSHSLELTYSGEGGVTIKQVTNDRIKDSYWEPTLFRWGDLLERPEGPVLTGEFSVAEGCTVQFSRGNLIATVDAEGNPTAWKMADHQYDYLGKTGANVTLGEAAGDIDLFGWSTTSTNYGVSTSEDNGDYSGSFADWGDAYCYYNNLSKGSWRTLSSNEWEYIFSGRTDAEEKYGYGTVNGVQGLIILPDSFTDPCRNEGDDEFLPQSYTGYGRNIYSGADWRVMENAGAVFLPAAGARYVRNLSRVGEDGTYYSSTPSGEDCAFATAFTNNYVTTQTDPFRYIGFSVRLVTDATIAPPAKPEPYVEISADYDLNPSTPNTTMKWYRQNLAISASGNKSWKGTNSTSVKVPGTDDDVINGDFFQWGAYQGYRGNAGDADKGLLIYSSFSSTGCGDGSNGFSFKKAVTGSEYWFSTNTENGYAGISPYYQDQEYTKYTGIEGDGRTTLEPSDDVAGIILGGSWRIPTLREFYALLEATYSEWDDKDQGYYLYYPDPRGVASDAGKVNDGCGTYQKEDALLFFPLCGCTNMDEFYRVGEGCTMMTSTLDEKDSECRFIYYENRDWFIYPSVFYRYAGYTVRPVSD